MTLGSLFDGVSGFPLVATWHGIEPVWASEIVPACISITKRHFPGMKHLGDITKINGAEIEPVDIITFGSPCQDLSVAGKRAGLAGERSGLFGEAIRIIDEMREATNDKYPEFAVWENVPGALSSNGGLDFRAVLQALTEAEIPIPESERWATAGMVRGGRCDVAWRILDAQHWGVPQRRRRIFLVADFRGQRSAEVLLKPEGLRGYFKTCGTKRQEVAGGVGGGAEEANYLVRMRSGCEGGGKGALISKDRSLTLTAKNDQVLFGAGELYENHPAGSRVTGPVEVCPTITERWGTGGGNTPIVCAGGVHVNAAVDVDLSPTLTTANDLPYIVAGFCHKASAGAGSVGYQDEVAPTLKAGQESAVFACRTDQTGSNGLGVSENVGYTLDGSNGQAVAPIGIDSEMNAMTDKMGTMRAHTSGGAEFFVKTDQIIRRPTPTECERLQGFPDQWTSHGHDGKPISDAARYRALGNSVALPCVGYVLGGIAEVLTCPTR